MIFFVSALLVSMVTCLFAVLLLALQERGENLSNAFCFSEVWDSVDANKVRHIEEFLSIFRVSADHTYSQQQLIF